MNMITWYSKEWFVFFIFKFEFGREWIRIDIDEYFYRYQKKNRKEKKTGKEIK